MGWFNVCVEEVFFGYVLVKVFGCEKDVLDKF